MTKSETARVLVKQCEAILFPISLLVRFMLPKVAVIFTDYIPLASHQNALSIWLKIKIPFRKIMPRDPEMHRSLNRERERIQIFCLWWWSSLLCADKGVCVWEREKNRGALEKAATGMSGTAAWKSMLSLSPRMHTHTHVFMYVLSFLVWFILLLLPFHLMGPIIHLIYLMISALQRCPFFLAFATGLFLLYIASS